MSETLAERLRQITADDNDEADVLFDAADLIEELQNEIERLRAENERLRAGGCARDQTTTQFCAQAVALQRRLDALNQQMPAIIEYLESQSDVVDGDNGIPHPNKAMALLVWLRHEQKS